MKKVFNIDNHVFRFFSKLIDVLIVNFLFLLFSIPILTFGAALTAMYTILLKIIRKKEGYIVKDFLSAFKTNFRASTISWLIILTLGAVFVIDFQLIQYLSGFFYIFLSSILLFFVFLYLCLITILFAYIARYDNTIKNSFMNSLGMGLSNPHYLLVLLLITIVPIVFVLTSSMGFVTGVYIGSFGGFSLLALIQSYFIEKIFYKYERKNMLE